MAKTELPEDLVVFLNPDNTPFSMDPRWHDPAIREAWQAKQDGVEDAEIEEEAEVDDYNAWTNDELRAELSERKLSLDGKKADMVKRLEEDDAKAGA